MKLTRYVCTHCGRRFEAEEKETIECPGCYWSTTVKKEEDLQEEKKETRVAAPKPQKSLSLPRLSFLKPLLVIVLAGGLLAFGIIFLLPRLQSLSSSIQFPSLPSPKSKGHAADSKKGTPSAPASPVLTEAEKNILQRRVELRPDRPVNPQEQSILKYQEPIKTGMVEKLPSQAWTLSNFKEMIAEQERFYKITLPHSYKKKLEAVFTEKYLPGQAAFEAGDLVKARNLWVESLVFPIYANDVAKHRGVVLTMIRAFINDTLSKIGSINSTLVEKAVREKERELSRTYQKLLETIPAKSWQEAYDLTHEMERRFNELENSSTAAGPAAPYPPTIQQVDSDVRTTLLSIQAPPPPSVADLTPLGKDVFNKRKVIQTFLPAFIEKQQAQYDDAVDSIVRAEWQEALKKLGQIEGRSILEQDAQEKIKILQKMSEKPAQEPRKA